MDVLAQPKSPVHILELLKEVNTSRFIAPIDYDELQNLKTARYFYVGDELVGFGIWLPIDRDWVEIGPFYVALSHRGQGYGKSIVQTLIDFNAGRKLYAAARNPIIERVLERFGFTSVSVINLPAPVRGYLLDKVTLERVLSVGHSLSLTESAQYIRE